jgi:hypothetical protein
MFAADDDANEGSDEGMIEHGEGLRKDAPEQLEGFLGEASVLLSAAQVRLPCSPMRHPVSCAWLPQAGPAPVAAQVVGCCWGTEYMYSSFRQRAHERAHAGRAGAVGT